MTDKLKNLNVAIKTITPVYIGAGEQAVLSPYTDYVRQGDYLVYIDSQKLMQLLIEKPEMIDEYVAGIKDGFDNNCSIFSLDIFIRNHLRVELSEVERCRVSVGGDIHKNEVHCFITSSRRPFIPGSTIKGAIRTAVLLDWMMNTTKGGSFLHQIKAHIEKNDWMALKNSEPERLCFGSIARDPFRHFRVSDSAFFPITSLSVSEIKRISIIHEQFRRQKRADIPLWCETLQPDSESFCTFSLELPSSVSGFSFIDNQSCSDLFRMINDQSRDSCSREINELEKAPREFDRLKRFYDMIHRQIETCSASEAIIRIGNGKNWFDNSIGLAVDNDEFGEQSLFEGYLRLLRLGHLPFPSTRTLQVCNGSPSTPLGWMKLSVLNGALNN